MFDKFTTHFYLKHFLIFPRDIHFDLSPSELSNDFSRSDYAQNSEYTCILYNPFTDVSEKDSISIIYRKETRHELIQQYPKFRLYQTVIIGPFSMMVSKLLP